MPLRLRSPSASSDDAPSLTFNWDNVGRPLTPDSTVSDNAPSPPANLLPIEDMYVYGAAPLIQPPAGIVRCRECDKPLLATALATHAVNCAEIRAGGDKTKLKEDGSTSKKRKSDGDEPDGPKKKKSKKRLLNRAKVLVSKVRRLTLPYQPLFPTNLHPRSGPLNLDKHCGVINKNGMPCARNITCKVHGMNAKRAVQGRTKSYDQLFIEHKRATDPNYVEPVKRETKAEKKAKKDRERELKKAEKEAVAAKKRKHPGAPHQGGGGGGINGGQVRGASTDYESGLDTDVEMDVLIRSVRATRPVPLADRDNVGNWFIARNEWLRSTRDLLGDALGGAGFSARRIG
ncbi:SCA7, zinc-binding domain protein [Rhizoctonia solani]|uniref:SCA7, zinc-binding domain protein n=1 Tax=Rhizoctonia solani TaxID=456999 RepID=A0A8H8SXA9_9AGAM|nr:SCA7, zinc-binding domain protein [Rhizoctonia solani]QRW20098.1 SCA7, zinc-binding domain protein [Rhizoctonia solani]